jgi:hypothetical protein
MAKNKHKIIQTRGLNFKFPYSSHVTGMFMIKNESIIKIEAYRKFYWDVNT